MHCSICGASEFVHRPVLWEELIAQWQLAPDEAAYINRQQGSFCAHCGGNLRSIALAQALLVALQTTPRQDSTLQQRMAGLVAGGDNNPALLEINEAGTLSPLLRQLPGYHFGAYPELDMHAIPYPDESFDLVVHSDTLEHIPNPIHALQECRRVLKPGGQLCMTVPTVVGRMSRDRNGLSKSFHGVPATSSDDYIVHTEFGADTWTYLLRAGFTEVSTHCVDYPAGIAYSARR